MGRMQEMREEGRSRVQIAMSKGALAPVIQQLMELQATLQEIPDRIEHAEEGRAERLRQTIQPTARALIEGMQILHTQISTFRDAAERQEAASRELQVEVAALRQETASQQHAMAVMQDDLAAFRETSTPGALTDLMAYLRGDLAQAREQVNELLAASAELLTDLRESAPPGPTSHGERKWSGPKQPSDGSVSSLLAVAWRILRMNLQRSDTESLPILDGYRRQALDTHPAGTGEDLILVTAWQLLEEHSRQADPTRLSQMQRMKVQARAVLGLPLEPTG